MEGFITIIIVAGIIYALFKGAEQVQREKIDKNRQDILESENSYSSIPLEDKHIRFFAKATYMGGYTAIPQAYDAFICVVGDGLYIQSITLAPRFRIDLSLITNFRAFQPDLPYIMNLNLAALAANEMTRRQVGNSAFVEFIDDIGMPQVIELGQFQMKSAESFVQFLHSNAERRFLIQEGETIHAEPVQPSQNFSMEEQGFDFYDYATYSAWCSQNEHEPIPPAQFEQTFGRKA